ncbi:MAG: hypothetical protein HC923_12265 [Myxococcales bacterium]|nr:hypothetical protein [Myxococcales bacterium]
MPVFHHRFTVHAPISAVRAFHGGPEVLKILSPPGTLVRLHRFGPLVDAMEADMTLWLGPVPVRWVARHEEVSESGFTDVMVQGPLRRWSHRHRFEAQSDSATDVIDTIDYEHHPTAVQGWTRLLFNAATLRVLFAHRARATRRAVEAA